MPIEFDPNAPTKAPSIPKYATYIPDRSPNFKMHKMISHGRNALSQRAGGWYGHTGTPGILYEHIGGAWVEIDRYEPPTHCAHCGIEFNSTKETFRDTYSNQNISHPRKVRVEGVISYKEPFVCALCNHKHFAWNAAEKIDPGSIGMRLF